MTRKPGQQLKSCGRQYDYGARFYDPVIARWNSVDLMSEMHTDLTPYNYVMNNPLLYSDEFGMDTTRVIRLQEIPIKSGSVNRIKPGVIFNWNQIDYKRAQRDPQGYDPEGMTRGTAVQAGLLLVPWGRVLKPLGVLLESVIGAEKLLPIVEALSAQKMIKIMSKSHAWGKWRLPKLKLKRLCQKL
ncbi:RHS repeat domain-containing protein [Hufsiella ginkgonis]|uniref:RHS repeat-associated core domain-containing protein n=1 Tax=Hufsiella ginkgonis TaxID=2695274 RepID=A0A7K1XUL5_9SPHI|nr:hypothetical protein [Hufsiella ginkgonis]